MEKTNLKGGCFVLPAVNDDGQNGPLLQVIGTRTGAAHLSQYALVVKEGQSPVYSFGQSDVLLFVIKGLAEITISGQVFEARPEAGLYVRPGEAFQITPSPQPSPTEGRGSQTEHAKKALSLEGNGDEMKDSDKALSLDGRGLGEGDSVKLLITVCPEAVAERLDAMPKNFDETFPDRMVSPDAGMREEMGDRYFQVLMGKKAGSEQVTQFIGEIPRSKAPSHHHLYEEALYVLEGSGFMWTGDDKMPVSKGSVIFLPRKQEHSLECTSSGGLRVVGHFTPAGSPAENY